MFSSISKILEFNVSLSSSEYFNEISDSKFWFDNIIWLCILLYDPSIKCIKSSSSSKNILYFCLDISNEWLDDEFSS